MATSTIVVTYTGTSGGADHEVQSFTVDGTAFASLTATQIRDASRLLRKAFKRLANDKANTSAFAGGL